MPRMTGGSIRLVTLNYGLRYEINGQITDTQNRLSNIETNRFVIASDDSGAINPLANALLPLIPVPVTTAKDAGYDRSLQLPNYHHIAPRVGLAWAVSDKTVVRAGWGLFFNQAAYNIQTALTENLPFFFNKSVNTSATTLIPTLTTENILDASSSGTIGGVRAQSQLSVGVRGLLELESAAPDRDRLGGASRLFRLARFRCGQQYVSEYPTPGPGPIDPRRPNPLLSGFKMIRWDGYSIYHSGTFKIEKRLSSGLDLECKLHLVQVDLMMPRMSVRPSRKPISRRTSAMFEPNGRCPASIIVIDWYSRTRISFRSGGKVD